jgi:CHASE3 domain sensor protein
MPRSFVNETRQSELADTADMADALGIVNRRLRRSLYVLALLTVVTIANGATAYLSIRRVASAEHSVRHTLQVQLALDQLLMSVIGAERAAQGYMLTGDRGFIDQYMQSAVEAHGAATSIELLTRDDPAQHGRAHELRSRMLPVLAWASSLVNTRSASSPELAMRKVSTTEGYALVDGLLSAEVRMRAEEESLLFERSQLSMRIVRSETLTLVIATGVSLLAMIAFGGTSRPVDIDMEEAAE